MKKIVCAVFSALFLLNIFSVPASAFSKGIEEKLLEVWRSGDEQALREFYEEYIDEDGGVSPGIYPKETAEAFRNAENQWIVLTLVFDREAVVQSQIGSFFLAYEKSEDYAKYFGKYNFTAVTEDFERYGTTVDATERRVYTVKELLRDFGIDDPSRIAMIRGSGSGCEYGYIQESDFTDYIDGWNEIDGDRYYIKPDGTVLTKSSVIDGIRYKFDQSGVCRGKYTGYTRSSKGRRYWKNGALLKNTWIKVKGKRKYYAGEDGYFVTGTREIRGETFVFDQNGVLRK